MILVYNINENIFEYTEYLKTRLPSINKQIYISEKKFSKSIFGQFKSYIDLIIIIFCLDRYSEASNDTMSLFCMLV